MLKQGVPNRPHDYIYDSTYTVAGKVDHIKQMTRSQAQQVIINPHFENMFSALRHYPAMHYTLKTNPFPQGIGQDRRTVAEPMNIAQNRFKYFKRPITLVPIFGGQIVYAKKKQKVIPEIQKEPELKKTTGTQTIYRDSQAQTDPYSPDYIFKPNEAPPELLALSSLTYGSGLPVGMAELEMIERARQKRQWELSLPVVVDQESFERRLKMMEEMELKEWEEREREIKRLQEQRLEILEKVIRKRERENEEENDKRVEKIWQRKMQEREQLLAKIEKKRAKALRKLQDQRQKVDRKVLKRDIIEEYGNYGSKVFAPKARDGVFRDKAATTLSIHIPELNDFKGLIDIESTLSKSILEPVVARVEVQQDRSIDSRRDKQLKEQLEQMNVKLRERKTKEADSREPIRYQVRIEKPPQRPPTPTLEFVTEEQEEMNIAAHILQNIIRGRVVQNRMYQNKERRLDLIKEVRARHLVRKAIKQNPEVAPNSISDSSVLTSELSEDMIRFESTVQAEYVGKQLDFLSKELVRLREEQRIAAMVKLAERTRCMREAHESTLRQQQLLEQRKDDAIFAQIIHVHQETVSSLLDSIIESSVEQTSNLASIQGTQLYAQQMDELAEQFDLLYFISNDRNHIGSEEDIVSDLVTSFLIPYVEKSLLRNKGDQC
jgi:hypothetical protein